MKYYDEKINNFKTAPGKKSVLKKQEVMKMV